MKKLLLLFSVIAVMTVTACAQVCTLPNFKTTMGSLSMAINFTPPSGAYYYAVSAVYDTNPMPGNPMIVQCGEKWCQTVYHYKTGLPIGISYPWSGLIYGTNYNLHLAIWSSTGAYICSHDFNVTIPPNPYATGTPGSTVVMQPDPNGVTYTRPPKGQGKKQ